MEKLINTLKISKLVTTVVVGLMLLLAPPIVLAKTLNEAVKTASKDGKRKVISARTVNMGKKRTHEVRVLTSKGKVKTVRYPANRNNNFKKSPKIRTHNLKTAPKPSKHNNKGH